MEGVGCRSDEGAATTAAPVCWGVSCAGLVASSASAPPKDDVRGRFAATAIVGPEASCAVESGVKPMVASSVLAALEDDVGGRPAAGATTTSAELVCGSRSSEQRGW